MRLVLSEAKDEGEGQTPSDPSPYLPGKIIKDFAIDYNCQHNCFEVVYLSLRGVPFSVIARSVNDEAISKRDSSFHSEQAPQSLRYCSTSFATRIATPLARNDKGLFLGVINI